MDKPLSDRELAALDPREREYILAWRESEEAGQKFNEDHGYGSVTCSTFIDSQGQHELTRQTGGSLDRQFAQLRQTQAKPLTDDQELKKWLKSKGILFGDSLEGTKLYFADEWDKLIEDYEKWRANMENCFLVLRNKKGIDPSRQNQDQFYRDQTKNNKKGIVARCQTRFSPGKRKVTRWRMEQFSEKVKRGGFRFGLEVTLTTDPKRFKCLDDVGDKWKFFIEKFMDFANKRLHRAGKKGTYCYLRACELTESGLLHIHIGFFGAGITGKIKKQYANGRVVEDYIFPQKDIADLWAKYGIGEVAWVMKKPVDDATDYVTKHVAKTWGRHDVNEMLESFLHYTGMRQWTCSKGAVPKEPDSLERWELVSFTIGERETTKLRDDLISDNYEFIRDDLKKSCT